MKNIIMCDEIDDYKEKECIMVVEDSAYLNNFIASNLRNNNFDVLTEKTSPPTPHQGWRQTAMGPGMKAPPRHTNATLLFGLDSCSSRAE